MSEAGARPVPAEIAVRRADAIAAIGLFAVDPPGLGGIRLRGGPEPGRDAVLALTRDLLGPGAAWRRVPPQIGEDRLLGGLDLAATLRAGRRVAARGLLAEADGGVAILAMAERIGPAMAALLAAALDGGTVTVARGGIETCLPARIGLVALDEGVEDEAPPSCLLDRLAFAISPDFATLDAGAAPTRAAILDARSRLGAAEACPEAAGWLCAAAQALGIASLRAPLLALRAAHAAAALAGRRTIAEEDAALAARLVLAPRATRLPASADAEPDPAPAKNEAPPAPSELDGGAEEISGSGAEIVLQAALAALPPGLLAALAASQGQPARSLHGGRSGPRTRPGRRGVPIGSRPGDPGRGRLDLFGTLRAAAPWQALRGRGPTDSIAIRREDFRIRRLRLPAETTTIFVVDASGSAAVHRLAEAKGAVELLLAECYIRRDRVAVLAFGGSGARLLLPPTRSLVRAKRSLATLPGGGGTPLAAGIEAGLALAGTVRRQGGSPTLVLLTDGRANVALGAAPRGEAVMHALAASHRVRDAGLAVLLVDIGPRPSLAARELGAAMGARTVPLPVADAAALARMVRAAAPVAHRAA